MSLTGKRLNRWNDARRALLRTMWHAGSSIKVIAHETEMSPASVKLERKKLCLPPRNQPELVKTHRVTVWFDDVQWGEIQKAAFGRYSSLSGYVRAIMLRDCGRPREMKE